MALEADISHAGPPLSRLFIVFSPAKVKPVWPHTHTLIFTPTHNYTPSLTYPHTHTHTHTHTHRHRQHTAEQLVYEQQKLPMGTLYIMTMPYSLGWKGKYGYNSTFLRPLIWRKNHQCRTFCLAKIYTSMIRLLWKSWNLQYLVHI